MTSLNNNAEGGTDTVVVSTGNSGGASGDAFTTVSGSPLYSATNPLTGTMSFAYSSGVQFVAWDDGAQQTSVSVRFSASIDANPSVTLQLMNNRTTGGGTAAQGGINIDTSGRVLVIVGPTSSIATGDPSIPLSQKVWFRMQGRGYGSGAGAASGDLQVYDQNGNQIHTESISGITSASQVQRYRFGNLAGTVTGLKVDDIAVVTGSDVPIALPPIIVSVVVVDGVASIPAVVVLNPTLVLPVVIAGVASIPGVLVAFVPAVVVAGTASIPSPTVTTATPALVTPTVVAAVASVPSVSASGTALASPVRVLGVTSVPSVVVLAPALATSVVVAGVATIPTPTVQTAAGTTVTPTTVAGQASIPAPGFSVGSVLSVAAVAGNTSIPGPTVTAGGSATVSPTVVAGQASIPAPAMSQAVPAVRVLGLTSIPTPSVVLGVVVGPTVVAGVASIPAPTISLGKLAQVTTVAGLTSVPSPTVTGASSILVSPSGVQALASIPAVAPSASIGAAVQVAVVRGRARIPFPAVQVPDPPAPTPAPTGSWQALWDIYREAAQWMAEDLAAPPVACPNDGEPLLTGPQGQLYCPFDGWQPGS